MRTPEQIYKRCKQFATGVTQEEFINVVKGIQDEAFMKGTESDLARAIHSKSSFEEGVNFVQSKFYTEEEVRELFQARSKEFSTKHEPFNKLLLKQDMGWFEKIRKNK